MSEFIEALEKFKTAAYGLEEVWEKTDHTGDYFATGYPFNKSFDEVAYEIERWWEIQSELNEDKMKALKNKLVR